VVIQPILGIFYYELQTYVTKTKNPAQTGFSGRALKESIIF